jgi:magnesium transporter
VIVDCAVYEHGRRRMGDLRVEDAYEAAREEGTFVWIGLHEPTEDEFDSVRREFELHELAVEDAVKAHQRPKLEVYGDSLLVVLKTVRWDESREHLAVGEILLFVGDDFVISVRHGETALHDVRLRMEDRPDLMRHGPSAVLYAIVDRVVDDYRPAIDELDAAIKAVEVDVFSPSRVNSAARIYNLKRQVLALDGVAAPLVDPLDALARGQHRLVRPEMQAYFRDVHDHLSRVVHQVTTFRELLTSVLTANLTQASVRQNDDVRKISAWAAIIAVPTAITGIYGMNFEYMPELEWKLGYPLVIVVIVIVCGLLYRQFRRIGWL